MGSLTRRSLAAETLLADEQPDGVDAERGVGPSVHALTVAERVNGPLELVAGETLDERNDAVRQRLGSLGVALREVVNRRFDVRQRLRRLDDAQWRARFRRRS